MNIIPSGLEMGAETAILAGSLLIAGCHASVNLYSGVQGCSPSNAIEQFQKEVADFQPSQWAAQAKLIRSEGPEGRELTNGCKHWLTKICEMITNWKVDDKLTADEAREQRVKLYKALAGVNKDSSAAAKEWEKDTTNMDAFRQMHRNLLSAGTSRNDDPDLKADGGNQTAKVLMNSQLDPRLYPSTFLMGNPDFSLAPNSNKVIELDEKVTDWLKEMYTSIVDSNDNPSKCSKALKSWVQDFRGTPGEDALKAPASEEGFVNMCLGTESERDYKMIDRRIVL